MEQLKEIYDSLDATKKQQFNSICNPDNYINVEIDNGHTIISYSKVKSNNCVEVKHPLSVLYACDIIFHAPTNYDIDTIKSIIQHIDLQCTDPNIIDIDEEANERLLKELNDLETEDEKVIKKYIERIEDAISFHTEYLENNKPVYDYISVIIENDNNDSNNKINYKKNDLYESLIAEKSPTELIQLFYELNIKTFQHMLQSSKLTTFHEELNSLLPTNDLTNLEQYISIFRTNINNIKKEKYGTYCIELTKKINNDIFAKKHTNIKLYNDFFDTIVTLCNKYIEYINTNNDSEEKFITSTNIMCELVTMMENFDKEKKYILSEIKSDLNNDNKELQLKISCIMEQMKIIVDIMNKLNINKKLI